MTYQITFDLENSGEIFKCSILGISDYGTSVAGVIANVLLKMEKEANKLAAIDSIYLQPGGRARKELLFRLLNGFPKEE